MTPAEADRNVPSTSTEDPRSLAEWTTLLISLAILIAAFMTVTYLYLAGGGDPIDIHAEANLLRVREEDGTFYVAVRVVNEGDSAASDVQIDADLTIDGEVESSSFSILTLAANDSETGIIAFSKDPRKGDFVVRVASYIE